MGQTIITLPAIGNLDMQGERLLNALIPEYAASTEFLAGTLVRVGDDVYFVTTTIPDTNTATTIPQNNVVDLVGSEGGGTTGVITSQQRLGVNGGAVLASSENPTGFNLSFSIGTTDVTALRTYIDDTLPTTGVQTYTLAPQEVILFDFNVRGEDITLVLVSGDRIRFGTASGQVDISASATIPPEISTAATFHLNSFAARLAALPAEDALLIAGTGVTITQNNEQITINSSATPTVDGSTITGAGTTADPYRVGFAVADTGADAAFDLRDIDTITFHEEDKTVPARTSLFGAAQNLGAETFDILVNLTSLPTNRNESFTFPIGTDLVIGNTTATLTAAVTSSSRVINASEVSFAIPANAVSATQGTLPLSVNPNTNFNITFPYHSASIDGSTTGDITIIGDVEVQGTLDLPGTGTGAEGNVVTRGANEGEYEFTPVAGASGIINSTSISAGSHINITNTADGIRIDAEALPSGGGGVGDGNLYYDEYFVPANAPANERVIVPASSAFGSVTSVVVRDSNGDVATDLAATIAATGVVTITTDPLPQDFSEYTFAVTYVDDDATNPESHTESFPVSVFPPVYFRTRNTTAYSGAMTNLTGTTAYVAPGDFQVVAVGSTTQTLRSASFVRPTGAIVIPRSGNRFIQMRVSNAVFTTDDARELVLASGGQLNTSMVTTVANGFTTYNFEVNANTAPNLEIRIGLHNQGQNSAMGDYANGPQGPPGPPGPAGPAGSGGGITSGTVFPGEETTNPTTPTQGDLFNYMRGRQDTEGRIGGLYRYENSRWVSLSPIVEIGTEFNSHPNIRGERVSQLTYFREQRRFLFRLGGEGTTAGEFLGDNLGVVQGVQWFNGTVPTTGINAPTAGVVAGIRMVNNVTIISLSDFDGTTLTPHSQSPFGISDLFVAEGTLLDTGNTRYRLSGIITSLALGGSSLGISLEGVEFVNAVTLDPLTLNNDFTGQSSNIFSAPENGVAIVDGNGVHLGQHQALQFAESSITERNVQGEERLFIDAEHNDFRNIRASSSTHEGEAVVLGSNGQYHTAPFPTNTGITLDEVRNEIHNYVDPYAITSDVTHTLQPRSGTVTNSRVLVENNRAVGEFRDFNVLVLTSPNGLEGTENAILSFPSDFDARVFFAEVTDSSPGVTPAAIPNAPWSSDTNVPATFRAGSTLSLHIDGLETPLNIPSGTRFTKHTATTGSLFEAAGSSFFVSFTVPASDQADFEPDRFAPGIYQGADYGFFTLSGFTQDREVEYPANNGDLNQAGNLGNGRFVHFRITRAEQQQLNLRSGDIIQVFNTQSADNAISPWVFTRSNGQTSTNIGNDDFPLLFRINLVENTTDTDDTTSGRRRYSRLQATDYVVAMYPYGHNPNSSNELVRMRLNNFHTFEFQKLHHYSDLPPNLRFRASGTTGSSTFGIHGRQSRQHVDLDGIPYDAIYRTTGPASGETHWLTNGIGDPANVSIGPLEVGERLFGFNYGLSTVRPFPASFRGGDGNTYSTEDLHSTITFINQASVGNDADDNDVHIIHTRNSSQLNDYAWGSNTTIEPTLKNLDGTYQAFYSRFSNGTVGGTRATEELTPVTSDFNVVTITQTINTDSITHRGAFFNLSSKAAANPMTRNMLDHLNLVRDNINPNSRTAERSSLRRIQAGASTAPNMTGVALTRVAISQTGNDIPDWDDIRNWIIIENNTDVLSNSGNWGVMYIGSVPLDSVITGISFEWEWRPPAGYMFNSGVDFNTVLPTQGQQLMRNQFYPALNHNAYFQYLFALAEVDRRDYRQGTTRLYLEPGVHLLNEDIPFRAQAGTANDENPSGLGEPLTEGNHSIWIKADNSESVRFIQRPGQTLITRPSSGPLQLDNGSGTLTNATINHVGDGSTFGSRYYTDSPLNTAANRRTAAAGFGIVFRVADINDGDDGDRLGLLDTLDLLGFGGNASPGYNANGLHVPGDSQRLILLINGSRYLVVGLGLRSSGDGQNPAHANECLIELSPLDGASALTGVAATTTAQIEVRRAVTELSQTLNAGSSGVSYFRYNPNADNTNGRGAFETFSTSNPVIT